MKPEEFFDVAELLRVMVAPSAEGCRRSAVSRYYYAAILEARDRLKDKRGWVFKKHEMHENVKRSYLWADQKRVKKVGRLLEDLKKMREAADYNLGGTIDPIAVGEAQVLSVDIRSALAIPDFEFSTCRDPSGRA